jgi:SAM-dependent methyltransferase
MDISDIIFTRRPTPLTPDDGKIPWDDAAFSQRMLDNHLSQEHDWASRTLPVIEQQVAWMARHLSDGSAILDLGCGPGLYTQRLAQRGFACTGVDFSPAAIHWARQQAHQHGLAIDYHQQDVRHFTPAQTYDLIMMTFGELNVFSTEDIRALLRRCASWLKPGGQLLLEVHTFEEVKRQGEAERSWQPCPTGLFLDRPHLLLTENQWDEAAQISTTLFWALEDNGSVTRFSSRTTAWRDEQYQQLLAECGFRNVCKIPADEWPVSATFDGKLFALIAVMTGE